MLSINMNLVGTILNLIILYALLKRFLIGPVTAIMDERRALIEDSMANARTREAESEALKRRYEERLKAADGEAARILEEARKQAKAEEERMMRDAGNQARQVLEEARAAAEREREDALSGARAQIGELAVLAARKLLSGGDAGADGKCYDEFLSSRELSISEPSRSVSREPVK